MAPLPDQAGWHASDKRVVPHTVTLAPVPPNGPELNPVTTTWQILRDNRLSNRIVEPDDDSVATGSDAWNKLADQPWTLTPIGSRDCSIAY